MPWQSSANGKRMKVLVKELEASQARLLQHKRYLEAEEANAASVRMQLDHMAAMVNQTDAQSHQLWSSLQPQSVAAVGVPTESEGAQLLEETILSPPQAAKEMGMSGSVTAAPHTVYGAGAISRRVSATPPSDPLHKRPLSPLPPEFNFEIDTKGVPLPKPAKPSDSGAGAAAGGMPEAMEMEVDPAMQLQSEGVFMQDTVNMDTGELPPPLLLLLLI
jgi:hypothetical protein